MLRVCPGCAQAVNGAGLRDKAPLLAMVMLVKAGRATRPPVHAYFQHQEWRKVWMHMLDRVEAQTVDEFSTLAAAKLVEAWFFGEGTLASSGEPSGAEPPEAHRHADRSGKIGVLLREHVMALWTRLQRWLV